MTNEIIKTTASFLARTKVTLIHHMPKILIGAGVITGGASLVTAIRATLKAQPAIEEMKTDVADIHLQLDDAQQNQADTTEIKRELTNVYLHFAKDMVKAYWPTVLLAGVSATCFITSHGVMASRNAALATAFAACEQEFNEYRNRVRDQIGVDAERSLYRNDTVIDEHEVVDSETGETHKTRTVECNIPMHSALFDNSSPNYENNNDYNLMFIQIQEQFINDKLRTQGFIFENDCRKLLGVPQTEAGQRCGWIYDPNGPTHPISFGITDYNLPLSDQRNILDNGIYLEFNTQGDIMDKVRW